MGYDFLIVGAGSAGCVLAARLSEVANVLLIEAGPDYVDPDALPEDLVNGWMLTTSHDWGYDSEPGVVGHRIELPKKSNTSDRDGCSASARQRRGEVQPSRNTRLHEATRSAIRRLEYPYKPDEPGIAAPVKVEPGKTRYPLLEEFARVTSHRIKWGSDQTSPTLLPNPACSS